VAFAVSAGNDNADASDYWPASFNNTLTVSSLSDFDGAPGGAGAFPWLNFACWPPDNDDTLSDFSNWGSAVDIAAPGHCIQSTYPGNSYSYLSGTSMASPHVAGALALLASNANPRPSTAAEVYALYTQVKQAGNYNWLDDFGDGIQERLLDVSSFPAALIPASPGPEPACDATCTVACTVDADCCDGHCCDGQETCDTVTGVCQPGTPPDCDDDVACTYDSCNEATDTCDHTSICPGDLICNPLTGGCECSDDADCDDGNECTVDTCDEAADLCVNTPINCDYGNFCNGAETCDPVLGCQPGSDPCPGKVCDEDENVCVDSECVAYKGSCVVHSDCCSNKCRGKTCK